MINTDFSLPEGATFKGQLKTTSKTSTDRSASASILSSTGSTLIINNTRLEYLTFTASNLTGSGYLQVAELGNGAMSVIIDHCAFDGVNGPDSQGAAINGAINEGSIYISSTTFNNVVASSSGASVYVYGFNNSISFDKCVFSGTRSATDVYGFGAKLTFTACTPNAPNTYPSLVCSGNTCTSP